jgi:hypothetical protein
MLRIFHRLIPMVYYKTSFSEQNYYKTSHAAFAAAMRCLVCVRERERKIKYIYINFSSSQSLSVCAAAAKNKQLVRSIFFCTASQPNQK